MSTKAFDTRKKNSKLQNNMGTETKIQWADSTWSPWRGCTKVSPGCANCYAETLAKRNPAVMGGWGKGAPRVMAKNWDEPMRWQKRTSMDMPRPRVFPSLCDWLDDEVPTEWLARFLQLIWDTPSIDWLLLTKRPELWAKRMRDCITPTVASRPALDWLKGAPPPNVWFGVSAEDQTRAEYRINAMADIPAIVRWVSAEPLLGPIDFTQWLTESRNQRLVEWIVVGGESGPNARPCHAHWIRTIVGKCREELVPVFVKQVGSRPTDYSFRTADWEALKDPKGGDMNEWPAELRVRQVPDR